MGRRMGWVVAWGAELRLMDAPGPARPCQTRSARARGLTVRVRLLELWLQWDPDLHIHYGRLAAVECSRADSRLPAHRVARSSSHVPITKLLTSPKVDHSAPFRKSHRT